MQRIMNVTDWIKVEHGSELQFKSGKPRRIRLDVNSPAEAQLYYVSGDGEVHFLALVKGRDTIEYYAHGAHSLMADGADCFILTSDGDDVSAIVDAPVSFTKIMERRPRNLELERINYEMQANLNRRLEMQREELDALYAKRLAALEAQSAAAGAAASAGSQPAPANNPAPEAAE